MNNDPLYNSVGRVLQQNTHLDISTNDYTQLGDEDETLMSKPDHHLREYQSFVHIQLNNNKTVSQLQWHPTINGLIAVACTERMTFDERAGFYFVLHFRSSPDSPVSFKSGQIEPNLFWRIKAKMQGNVSKFSVLFRNHGSSLYIPKVDFKTIELRVYLPPDNLAQA